MADLSITAANVVAAASSPKRTGIAGATITAGQIVYLDSSDGKYKLADADAPGIENVRILFMALGGAANNQPITVMRTGDVALGAVLTAGTSYYLSATAGSIAPRADLGAGNTVVLLGIARSSTVLAFRPVNSGVELS